MDKTSADYLGPLSGTPQARASRRGVLLHVAARADDGACACARAQAVVDAALDFAGVTADDVLYDLGCNDGTHAINALARIRARCPSFRPCCARALH
jgi:hypothetical protein